MLPIFFHFILQAVIFFGEVFQLFLRSGHLVEIQRLRSAFGSLASAAILFTSTTEAIRGIQDDLSATLPKLCAYFREPRFMNLSTELERYHREVEKHYREFGHARATWARLVEHAASVGEPD